MATFPSFSQHERSTWKPRAGILTDVSEGGSIRLRRMWDESVYAGEIVLIITSEADRTTMKSFYTTNRDLEFTFSFSADPSAEGNTYSCRFTNEIEWEWFGDTSWYCRCSMIGTMD